MGTETRGARRARKGSRLQEDAYFWNSVLSSVTSSLITAWILFVLGTAIAIAAKGDPGEDLDLPSAAAFVVIGLLASACAWGCVWYSGAFFRGWSWPTPLRGWFLLMLFGAMAVDGLAYLNASSWVIGPLFLVLVAGLLAYAFSSRLFTRSAHRAFHLFALVFGAVGFTSSAVVMGAVAARILSTLK